MKGRFIRIIIPEIPCVQIMLKHKTDIFSGHMRQDFIPLAVGTRQEQNKIHGTFIGYY